ncbi:TPA: hypothetical protein DCZ39_01190 [Patescibacteria group bacterium]|nr:hypothetical protein [Candidatus Gracilibacteria bacterium]
MIHPPKSLSPARFAGVVKIAMLAKPNLIFCATFLSSLVRRVCEGGANTLPLNRLGFTYCPR